MERSRCAEALRHSCRVAHDVASRRGKRRVCKSSIDVQAVARDSTYESYEPDPRVRIKGVFVPFDRSGSSGPALRTVTGSPWTLGCVIVERVLGCVHRNTWH